MISNETLSLKSINATDGSEDLGQTTFFRNKQGVKEQFLMICGLKLGGNSILYKKSMVQNCSILNLTSGSLISCNLVLSKADPSK